jgi:5-methyltetrahydrofolate--homocysteine methyltransferase
MKENLEEMNAPRGRRRYPVLLGGAALTRAFVEQDLAEVYDGEVRYARDAFEGLRLMDAVMAVKRGVPGRRAARRARPDGSRGARRPARRRRGTCPARSDVAVDNPVPTPPFWGSASSRASRWPTTRPTSTSGPLFLGQWGLKPSPRRAGPSYEELVETEGRPRLRMWLDRVHTEGLIEAAVVYGYFPCGRRATTSSSCTTRVRLTEGREVGRFTFPRQRRDRHLCLADFFRPAGPARSTSSPSTS